MPPAPDHTVTSTQLSETRGHFTADHKSQVGLQTQSEPCCERPTCCGVSGPRQRKEWRLEVCLFGFCIKKKIQRKCATVADT